MLFIYYKYVFSINRLKYKNHNSSSFVLAFQIYKSVTRKENKLVCEFVRCITVFAKTKVM